MNTGRNKRIVVIGGAAAASVVIKCLESDFKHFTAVLTTADDGGSGGMARRQFRMQAPGDARQTLLALSHSKDKKLLRLLAHRFTSGPLKGHVFGTLLIAELTQAGSSFQSAIETMRRMLDVRADIIPITEEPTTLHAKLENGRIIRGETNIDIPKHNPNLAIESVWLFPNEPISERAAAAIKSADTIIIGPGDLYSSLVPVLLPHGTGRALAASKAKIIYICNLMTKHGETTGFAASDFIRVVENYLAPAAIDIALINSRAPSPSQQRQYAKERSEPVIIDWLNLGGKPPVAVVDLMQTKSFAHHDPAKLRRALKKLI